VKQYLFILIFLLISTSLIAGSGVYIPSPASNAVEWAGVTPATYDGDGAGNYINANGFCSATYSGSHVCHNDEMLRLIDQGSNFGGSIANVWVNDGAPGYTSNANDCYSWSQTGAGYYGRYWRLGDLRGQMSGCASSYAYACCR
jgi:hypothetical protein